MPEYRLYCFAQSGNAYKAALMLNLCGADWEARFVDFFNGETRTPEFRQINEMGEVPVLEHQKKRLSQSGVILDYLVARFEKFGWADEDERREILRWLLWDNHKLTSYIGTLRFLTRFMKTGETPVTEFLRGRVQAALGVLNRHGRPPFRARGAPDHRRYFDVRLSLLARRVRRRLGRLSADRRLAGADQGPAGLGPPLRADAGSPPAAAGLTAAVDDGLLGSDLG
jgi:glutathione S-transferase